MKVTLESVLHRCGDQDEEGLISRTLLGFQLLSSGEQCGVRACMRVCPCSCTCLCAWCVCEEVTWT